LLKAGVTLPIYTFIFQIISINCLRLPCSLFHAIHSSAMTKESRWALEPMCALDPLLLIPRIEYAQDVYDCVLAKAKDYCLVILDMKNFHVINDIHGYDIGDKVIETFVRKLRQRLPSESISLRFRHGDEFLFFVPGNTDDVEMIFSSFLEACERRPALTVAEQDILVSYKFAVLNLTRSGESISGLLTMAEKALRLAKGKGSPRT